jgi:glutamate dehydrogenase
MHEETGATVSEIALCYSMAKAIFELGDTWQEISTLDNTIPSNVQTEMLHQMRRTVRRATRWFLRHRNKALGIEQTIAFFSPAFAELSNNITKHMTADEADKLLSEISLLEQQGVPKTLAKRIKQLSSLFSVMDLAQVADISKMTIAQVSETYFKLGARMGLHWFLEQITHQPVANHWQALARASYREELDWQQRALSQVVLSNCENGECDVDTIINNWMNEHHILLERWQHMLSEFKTSQSHDFAKFSVALRELMLLSHNCDTAK